MAKFKVRPLELYEVYDEETGERYTLVEDADVAEQQKQEAQKKADAGE